jgi:hypothetical protein
MAKRDPNKTARNKLIKKLKGERRMLLKQVLDETGIKDEASLNAKIGHKTDHFIDLKNEVINGPEEYIGLWLAGLKRAENRLGSIKTAYDELADHIRSSPAMKAYLMKLLRGSYYKHYEALSKTRPAVEQAAIWIGQNNADYGLLVTPRLGRNGWENDKSEIRHFNPRYWSIGHVLKSGLVVNGEKDVMTFANVEDYLKFFKNVLVRQTASIHQKKIAELYCDYVRNAKKPEDLPLLIPEFRYGGADAKHEYRLDFCLIDADTMNRIGFELSPWSTHGQLTGIAGKTQKQVNAEALANFEKEMKKHKSFFRKHDVFVMIYTDTDLKNIDEVFADMVKYLKPKNINKQLEFALLAEHDLL